MNGSEIQNCLEVEFAQPKSSGKPSKWYPDISSLNLSGAYRVMVRVSEFDLQALAMGFPRRKDAEAARSALIREGLTTPELLRNAGRKRIDQIMIEAMAW